MLPCHARYALSCLCCNGHSLLLTSYLSRIRRIKNSFCSTCRHSSQVTSHLILHCPARTLYATHSSSILCFLRSLVQTLGNCLASGAPWSSAMPPFLGRGQVINNNSNYFIEKAENSICCCFEKTCAIYFDITIKLASAKKKCLFFSTNR